MGFPKIRMRSKLLAFLLVFIVAGFIFIFFVDINPPSRINCWFEDIDILTARYRYQRYILFIKVNERIKETPLSRIWKKHFGQYPMPDWRRVNAFSGFGGYSPHYLYHGALFAAHTLEESFKIESFSEGAERKAIEVFLQLLQKKHNYFSAGRYCSFIASKAIDKKEGQVIEENDIPSFDKWTEREKEN